MHTERANLVSNRHGLHKVLHMAIREQKKCEDGWKAKIMVSGDSQRHYSANNCRNRCAMW